MEIVQLWWMPEHKSYKTYWNGSFGDRSSRPKPQNGLEKSIPVRFSSKRSQKETEVQVEVQKVAVSRASSVYFSMLSSGMLHITARLKPIGMCWFGLIYGILNVSSRTGLRLCRVWLSFLKSLMQVTQYYLYVYFKLVSWRLIFVCSLPSSHLVIT